MIMREVENRGGGQIGARHGVSEGERGQVGRQGGWEGWHQGGRERTDVSLRREGSRLGMSIVRER